MLAVWRKIALPLSRVGTILQEGNDSSVAALEVTRTTRASLGIAAPLRGHSQTVLLQTASWLLTERSDAVRDRLLKAATETRKGERKSRVP